MPDFRFGSRHRCHPNRILTLLLLALAGTTGAARSQDSSVDLTSIGIEAVMNMEVTSVSKKPETLRDSPAAVYVITSEDIRRSGATSLPDLLRLVPGVQVARVNSSTWAVGVRGFTSSLSRSLLVLIDGRSVYSPLFAGVYWDAQDTLFNDIERIEVIRGPGATLWGANAVNGVINIITKSAQATQGAYASLRLGNEDRLVATGRFGSKTSGNVAFRTFAKFSDRDAQFHADGDDYDGWHMALAGFRLDADPQNQDHLSFQGSAYSGSAGARSTITTYTSPYLRIDEEDTDLWGADLLGQWKHRLGGNSETTLQLYYDRTHRSQSAFQEDRDTFDVDFRHLIQVGSRHDLLWGAGYRITSGDTESVPTIQFSPPDRTDDVWSAFVQDEIRLVPSRWTLTIGSKFEHNDYNGFDCQPNIRLLFSPGPRHVLWSAISRALRIPSRVESDLSITALLEPTTPTFIRVVGTKDFEPERLVAYEAGYRVEAAKRLFLDFAVFYNDYDQLLSLEPGTPFTETSPPPNHTVIPIFFRNKMTAKAGGAELAYEWQPLDVWRLSGSYSYLRLNAVSAADSGDTTTAGSIEGSSPRHMAGLRSALDLPRSFSLDMTLRYVGSLPRQRVEGYTEMDVMFSRRLTHGIEVSLAGQNLLSRHHAEFAGGATEIERSFLGRFVRRW
ncbi:MAG TPA: TonB-dependent receptor plug domain-containing protein [Candidatus Polarisedimenticolia bacterium]|nr:TonB-dependent receptor plug domain-containing protein [Candidatus Polarisedimenticolia bacterium]